METRDTYDRFKSMITNINPTRHFARFDKLEAKINLPVVKQSLKRSVHDPINVSDIDGAQPAKIRNVNCCCLFFLIFQEIIPPSHSIMRSKIWGSRLMIFRFEKMIIENIWLQYVALWIITLRCLLRCRLCWNRFLLKAEPFEMFPQNHTLIKGHAPLKLSKFKARSQIMLHL